MSVLPLFDYFPQVLRTILYKMPPNIRGELEEIRLRSQNPLLIRLRDGSFFVDRQGMLHKEAELGYVVTTSNINACFEQFTRSSAYAFVNELTSGYITVEGGHRIGFCGKCAIMDGQVGALKEVSSINVRVARQIIGAADGVMDSVVRDGCVRNVLIISPPGCGKTTLLRDIARQLSNGFSGFDGVNVAIADERSEIAASFQGIPQNDLGLRCDVMDACPKARGIMMMLRSMAPDVIITDEIGTREDAAAIHEALNAGVCVIASAHGSSVEEVTRRITLSDVIGVFDCFIVLSNRGGAHTVAEIRDGGDRDAG